MAARSGRPMPPHDVAAEPCTVRLCTVSRLPAMTTKPMTVISASADATRRRSEGWRASGSLASSQADSRAGHGLDDRRVAELAAQRHHRHPDRVREWIRVLVPCFFQ